MSEPKVLDVTLLIDLEVRYHLHDEVTVVLDMQDLPCKHCRRRRSNHAVDRCLFDTSTYEAMTRQEIDDAIKEL